MGGQQGDQAVGLQQGGRRENQEGKEAGGTVRRIIERQKGVNPYLSGEARIRTVRK
jgi:hypothetical protein